MATAASTPARRRGATATHADETLLALVADVARFATADARWAVRLPERVSMRVFNEAKLDFDRARGLSDPTTDPERTPTANAVVMRFNERAVRRVSWAEVLAAALRGDPTMWLSAVRRAEAVRPVASHELVFALRYVAARLGVPTLTRAEYRAGRDDAVAEDIERNGEDALLDKLLPTLNHIDGQMRWAQALDVARLRAPTPRRPAARRPRPATGANGGLPIAQAAAHYAALNGAWPSYPTLLAWARDTGFAMQDRPTGGWKPVIAAARELLVEAGLEPPAGQGPKPLGKGKRLSYRYPLAGIPGAPTRSSDPVRASDHEELCVLALRMWLADHSGSSRDDYLRWQVDSGWPAASRFDQHGGFKALRARAREQNTGEWRAHGEAVTPATRERAELLRNRLAAIKGDPCRSARPSAGYSPPSSAQARRRGRSNRAQPADDAAGAGRRP